MCKCDCGNEKIVVSDNLSSGKSNSCGCLLHEVTGRSNQYGYYKDREETISRVQYAHLKRRNKKFIGEVMSFEEFATKLKSPCFYCGLDYSRELQDRRNETKSKGLASDIVVKCNGIDRINSNIGYTSENTVPCCKSCNTAKSTMSVENFKSWITRLYNNFIMNKNT